MPAQALHRRLSSVDSSAHAGDGSGLLPHTALRRCLDAWVPLLIDECDFAAAFLLLYKPMDEVPGAGQDAFAGECRGICFHIIFIETPQRFPLGLPHLGEMQAM